MSVFKSFKGKIKGVKDDIGASLKNLTSKSKQDQFSIPNSTTVNLNAGADLLNEFQEKWQEMSKTTQENAKEAQVLDKMISGLHSECTRQTETVTNFFILVSGLPELLKNIHTSIENIDSLEMKIAEVESLMCILGDEQDREEFMTNQNQHHYQLQAYKARKAADLEQVKVGLAQQHGERVRGYEARLQGLLQEKQAAFQEEFNQEMEHYKIYGQTLMKPVLQGVQQTDISDVQVEEEDTAALDDFLKSDEFQNSTSHNNANETSAPDEQPISSNNESTNRTLSAPDADDNLKSTEQTSNDVKVSGLDNSNNNVENEQKEENEEVFVEVTADEDLEDETIEKIVREGSIESGPIEESSSSSEEKENT